MLDVKFIWEAALILPNISWRGAGIIWLGANEIAKIGVSTNGKSRYSIEYYELHGVSYWMEYRGDLTTAKNREIARLGSYPLLPENQKREFKLVYPPLNSKLD